MENKTQLQEFLEDLFFWMDENDMESITQNQIIGFLIKYADDLEAEADGLSAMMHDKKTEEFLKKLGIISPNSGNSETNFNI